MESGLDSSFPSASASRVVWLTWYAHRRTSSICAQWCVPLEVMDYQGRWCRRAIQVYRTFVRILTARETVIIVQNPSLGLTAIAVLLRKVRRFRLVVDAHNEGIRPFIRRGHFIRFLTRLIVRTADVTMVTNEELALQVRELGGIPVVLPDPLPVLDFPMRNRIGLAGEKPIVVAVMTYAPDEPVEEILAAATLLDKHVRFVLTGKAPEAVRRYSLQLGAVVEFTGFLPERAYAQLLYEAACVVDLSKMDDCLVCGAYEALAAGTPAVLSNSPAARRLFGDAVVLVSNTPGEIANAIRMVLENIDEYRAAGTRVASTFRRQWECYSSKARHVALD